MTCYKGHFFFLFSLLVLLPVASGRQLQERVEVQLVQVDVVATDSKGSHITDLKLEDFTLKENGNIKKITHFYNSSSEESRFPLAMSFVVDTSYSMHEKVAGMTRIGIAVQAAELVMNQLKPEDQIELIEFNNKPEAIVSFTSDMNLIREKFKTLDFREANTAMHDAVLFGLDRIKGRSGRKIIVVFSDGVDSASKSVEEDVIEAVRKSDATIIVFYSEFARLNLPIEMGGNPNSMGRMRVRAGEDTLRSYTEMTGGQFFSFKKEPELLKAIESFRAFVSSQYTLAYTPDAPKKKSEWRKIKIECKRKGVQLRHRVGYTL
ncbi:VWA domain-containing protein [bacterium]|nr:VWA domain-containing protein [bacterium]MCI0605144.1 VWA domain-containing protein [bacterium]